MFYGIVAPRLLTLLDVRPMALTPQQIDQFRQLGYIAPVDVLSTAEAANLAQQLVVAERDYPEVVNPQKRNNVHACFPFLANLAKHPRIVDAVRELVGADIVLSASVLFVKEAHSTAYVSWHQDAQYMGLAPANFVTAWVALTPSTLATGCVSVLPGTQHSPGLEHDDTFDDDNILTRGQKVRNVDTSNVVHLELEPGQMSLHHPWLVHASQPNSSNERRVGVAYQSYLGADVHPVRGSHHVMHICGAPVTERFTEVMPPTTTCDPQSLAARDAADAAYANVLYEGAAQRRRL